MIFHVDSWTEQASVKETPLNVKNIDILYYFNTIIPILIVKQYHTIWKYFLWVRKFLVWEMNQKFFALISNVLNYAKNFGFWFQTLFFFFYSVGKILTRLPSLPVSMAVFKIMHFHFQNYITLESLNGLKQQFVQIQINFLNFIYKIALSRYNTHHFVLFFTNWITQLPPIIITFSLMM